MKSTLLLLISFLGSLSLLGQDLSYYLPENISYDPDIPTPKEVLGFEVGEWHVSHDQLVYYMRMLDEASDRIQIQEYARTHEGRPLMLLIITNPDQLENLEEIRTRHVSITDPSSNTAIEGTKLVHWMGYSIHGNEASGSNSALLAAYFLAAAQGPFIEKVLDEMVILFDPSYNPDGLQRFSTWVNSHRSKNLVSDPNAREFDEVWPGGRTNHYWFDLNRDWMPVRHPESQGRIKMFHQWKPNVLTDHHEMGTYSTFFFQPGVPSRKNPLTPEANVAMTKRIAQYHADALDSIGSLYFAEESYDDFFIGKGSTYPDLNGSIGILFEQASSRGHIQESPFGELKFSFAIRNHFVTSISTLKAAIALKEDLLSMQKNFYKESVQLASADPVKALVFGSNADPVRSFELMDLIRQHDIDIYSLAQDFSQSGKTFDKESSYIIPLNQPQYRLVKSMFETRTSFEDSIFYDISTWTLPLAFDLNYEEVGRAYSSSLLGNEVADPVFPSAEVLGESDYAYIFEPYGYYTQRAMNRLFKKEVLVQVAHKNINTGSKVFARGSIVIPLGVQKSKKEIIESTLEEIALEDGLTVYPLSTGYTEVGIDLGSRDIDVLEKPEMAVLVGEGITSYEAGEVWHLLDQRYDLNVTLLPASSLGSVDLSRYNRLIFPNGSYRSTTVSASKLRDWLIGGGVIVAWKEGARWLADQKLTNVSYKTIPRDTTGFKRYVDLEYNSGAQEIAGAIFMGKVDMGHPLSYGMEDELIPLFRDHSRFMNKASNPYANPLVYTPNPLISGYISEEKFPLVGNSPAVQVTGVGRGRIISFADNPNFRAFWYGTNKLFMNALFFGATISSSATE